MELDWRMDLILRMLAAGNTLGEAAKAAGVHRQSVLRWRWESPGFSGLVDEALEKGKAEREFRLWLRHPFRGCRPPTGKGFRGKPRFSYGRG